MSNLNKSLPEISAQLLNSIFSHDIFLELAVSQMYSAILKNSSKYFIIPKEFGSNTIGFPISQTHLDVYDLYEFDGQALKYSEKNNLSFTHNKSLENSYPLIIHFSNPILSNPLPQIDIESEMLRNDLLDLFQVSLNWQIKKNEKILPILAMSQTIDNTLDKINLLLLQQKKLFNNNQIKKILKEYVLITESTIDFSLKPYEYQIILGSLKKYYNWSILHYSSKSNSFKDYTSYYKKSQKNFTLKEILNFESIESSINLNHFVF
ncbi:MAG TPA: hypothetical protein PLX15_00075 [Candidatus Woesearchaeota archaeon]|nr:hypothetical protein [Candidatus Woesearchaeota archaeon]